RALLLAQRFELLFDANGLEPRELPQPDLQDVLGLSLAQAKRRNQRGLRFVGLADDPDDLVDAQQHELPPFEDVDPVYDLAEAMLAAPRDRASAELAPFGEDRRQVLLARPSVEPDGDEVHRDARFQARMRTEHA